MKVRYLLAIPIGVIGLLYAFQVVRTQIDRAHRREGMLGYVRQVMQQNNIAFEERLHQKADSVQNLALLVIALGNTAEDLQSRTAYYRGLVQTLRIRVDNATTSGGVTTDVHEDSSVQLLFSGTQPVAKYSGFVQYYPQDTGRTFHRLTLSPSPITIINPSEPHFISSSIFNNIRCGTMHGIISITSNIYN